MARTIANFETSRSFLSQIPPVTADSLYSIRLISSSPASATYAIREKDNFGEYPNIFAKVYYELDDIPSTIILSDSGTGLDSKNGQNIATFLEATINPGHIAPYVVITTHCHYDHICGIQKLLDAHTNVKVLSSSHDVSYITPWRKLQRHSLCEANGLLAPRYDGNWVDDCQKVTFWKQGRLQTSSITVIHTPGHTPDSLSWYDHESHALCVGDMFYEKESDETRSGSHGLWPREPPQPVIFTDDSNIIEWNASMHRLLDFVQAENRRLTTHQDTIGDACKEQVGTGTPFTFDTTMSNDEDNWALITSCPTRKRVTICASHVTVETDAETALLDMLNFMLRIQLDQVPRQKVQTPDGRTDVWLWDDCQQTNDTKTCSNGCRYSVRAPWNFVYGRPRR